jgi:hypothetical protein
MTPKQFEREVTAFFREVTIVHDFKARTYPNITITWCNERGTKYWWLRMDNEEDIWSDASGPSLLEAYRALHGDVLDCLDERRMQIDDALMKCPVRDEQA